MPDITISNAIAEGALTTSYARIGKVISPLATTATGTALAGKVLGMTITDETFIYNSSNAGWIRVITDPHEFHDFTYTKLTVSIYDYLLYQVSEATQHDANAICSDSVILTTAATVKYIIKLVTDAIINSDTVTTSWGRILRDIVSYSESVTRNLSMIANASDAIDATDLITYAWFLQVSETLTTTEAVSLIPLMYALASDNLTMATSVSSTCRISFAIADTSTLTSTVGTKATFNNLIQDNLGFIIRITLDNETYQCWVLNTNELYPSCYSNFSFNSYAELDGTSYAASETGICKLTGTTDNGTEIETGLRLNIFNTGIQKGKRFDNARFGISGTNLALKVTTENDSIQYYVLNGRCKIARGQHGREWVFELAKADHIDFIELYPAILSR